MNEEQNAMLAEMRKRWDDDFSAMMFSAKLAQKQEWMKWQKEIPFIQWPADWLVKAVPPFAGAIIRYRVKKMENKNSVSIYLDCYDQLGCFGEPYWEIFPVEGDTYRCAMKNTDELLEQIKIALEKIDDNRE